MMTATPKRATPTGSGKTRSDLTALARALLSELNREKWEGCTVRELVRKMSDIADPDESRSAYGRCDTCGKTCDEDGCTADRSHAIANG